MGIDSYSLRELNTENIAEFNFNCPNEEGVQYYSAGGETQTPTHHNLSLINKEFTN